MDVQAGPSRFERTAVTGAAVEFEGVTKSYAGLMVLRPTSMAIARGEFFAIIGPSGSGKSTLLGIVAGFAPATAGNVRVDGINVLNMPPYRRRFGMVFQGYALFPHMSVAENIAFPLKMRKCPREEIRAGVERALSMVRLEAFADRYPSQLSGGQQQRVALARAAVYNPPLLLMDEPLGALDKNLREEMQEEIKSFQAKLGATVIYVTHDQHEAAFMADRLAVMHRGSIEQIGTPREIYERPSNRFVASFLGEATIFPDAVLAAIDGATARIRVAHGLEMRVAMPVTCGPTSTLCLRPETIVIGEAAAGLANSFAALVIEAVFTTGSVRYKVRIGDDKVLTVRTPVSPGAALYEPGTTMKVGWDAQAMCVLQD
jgi:putative spermidine/putrescine transport system ATP-binding protein